MSSRSRGRRAIPAYPSDSHANRARSDDSDHGRSLWLPPCIGFVDRPSSQRGEDARAETVGGRGSGGDAATVRVFIGEDRTAFPVGVGVEEEEGEEEEEGKDEEQDGGCVGWYKP